MQLHRNSKLARLSLVSLAGIAVMLFLGATIFFAQTASGDHDPDQVPDSDLIASGPIMDQQTVDANYATKVALVEEEKRESSGPPDGPKDPNYVPPPVTPEPTGPTGIMEAGPLPSGWGSVYHIENGWAGTVGGLRTRAFAGMIYDDRAFVRSSVPEQGVLVVMSFPTDLKVNPDINSYLTPTRSGPLRLTSYNGTCLSFTETNATPPGATVYEFDLTTRQWTCNY